ncbi:MAG: hypothetical protein PVI40_01945 [Chlamydiota bacterium]|jgi:hypothetical protein
MQIVVENPRVNAGFSSTYSDSLSTCYRETIQQILKKALPNKLFFSTDISTQIIQKRQAFVHDFFPMVKWDFPENNAGSVSVVLICSHRLNASSFFYDMISRFLIPHKRLNLDLFFSADFRLPEISDSPFTAAEISFSIQSSQELEEIKKSYRSIETEIRLGVVSNYHASRILEFKGLSLDGKTAMIQEKIGSLIQNRSKEFDRSIVTQMQHFLINCQEEFKSIRDYHHISRIISVLHTLRKLLNQQITEQPNQRHLIVKFLKTKVKTKTAEKFVLGIMVGLNFLRKREVFEKTHLVRAIKDFLPNVKAIDDSFFLDRNRENSIQSVYLEIEKKDGQDFSYEEVKLLRKNLPEHLKGYIEHLMHPVFMPRNEEEVLKNIMVLSKQLKYVNDIPQVIINFEEQKEEELSYTVILLRVLNKQSKPLYDLLPMNGEIKFISERVKKVGVIRKKYYKEANVFKALVNKSKYYRSNLTLDIQRARQDIALTIQQIFGEIRDYNGGMILKQNETFNDLKIHIGKLSLQNELFLEKFFFSLSPVEMRSLLKPAPLKNLFFLFLHCLKKQKNNERHGVVVKIQEEAVYVAMPSQSITKNKSLTAAIESLKIDSYRLVASKFDPLEVPLQGYIFFSNNHAEKKRFVQTLQQSLDF